MNTRSFLWRWTVLGLALSGPAYVATSGPVPQGPHCVYNNNPYAHGQWECFVAEGGEDPTWHQCLDGDWIDSGRPCEPTEALVQRRIVPEAEFALIRDGILQSLTRRGRDPNLWWDLELPGEGRPVTIDGTTYQYRKGLWVRL